MLHVLGRVLPAHEPRCRELELTPVHHYRGRHREALVLTGVVDVGVRVQDVADVPELHPEAPELVLETLLLADGARHVEPTHDLRVASACVDENGVVAAEDQVAPGRSLGADAHVVGEHEETRLELDVDERQDLDLEGHRPTSTVVAIRASISRSRAART